MRNQSPVSPEIAGAQQLILKAGEMALDYGVAERQLAAAEAAMRPVREMMELVEAGLPEGTYVATMTSAHHIQQSYLKGAKPDISVGSSTIYRPGDGGEYTPWAGLITLGKELPFLGARLLLRGGSLVVVDEVGQIGLSVRRSVFITDDSELERQFESETQRLLADTEPGALNVFDLTAQPA